jgi:HD superfamily phosphohydrolase
MIMLSDLKSEYYFDPVYRESLMKSPSGRGLFFAPDAVKRINKTLDIILSSVELHRLHFINEDPFYALCYPSANYSAFSQLIGTFHLSDLCRKKISVDGTMFFQWLLDKNLLEEYMMALLLDRVVRLPMDGVLATEEPFLKIAKWEIIESLLNQKGLYYEAWKLKFSDKGEIDTLQTIKEKLKETFDTEKVVQIFKGEENLGYELKVLRTFVSGELDLARTDRTFRLAFGTGKNYDNLNVDMLFQNIDIDREGNNLKFSVHDDETSKQMFKFYSTYYDMLLSEIILHQDICFYRGLFRKSFAEYIDQSKKKKLSIEQIILDTLFMNDIELWHKLNENNSSFETKILYGQRYENYFRIEIKANIDTIKKYLAATYVNLKKNLGLAKEDIIVDITFPTNTDKIWLSPQQFRGMEKYSTKKRLKVIKDKIDKCYISFFTQKEVSENTFKKTICEIFHG